MLCWRFHSGDLGLVTQHDWGHSWGRERLTNTWFIFWKCLTQWNKQLHVVDGRVCSRTKKGGQTGEREPRVMSLNRTRDSACSSTLLTAGFFFLLIVWHIKGTTASWIKASATESVLYCGISFWRHSRDSHRHREAKRGRQREAMKNTEAEEDNRCVKGIFQS